MAAFSCFSPDKTTFKMLWTPKSCCCGCRVREGSLIIGWLSLIANLILLLCMSTLVANDPEDFVRHTCPADFEHCHTADFYITAVVASLCVIAGLKVIVSILFLVGVNKNKPNLMLPYLVVKGIGTFIYIAFILFMLAFIIYFGNFIAALLIAMISGLFAFLFVYFLLVVRACHKEVKALTIVFSR